MSKAVMIAAPFTGDSDHCFYFLICTFTRCKCISLHTADHFDTAEPISLALPFKKAQHHWSVRDRTCLEPSWWRPHVPLGLLSSGAPQPRQTDWTFPGPKRTGGGLAFLCMMTIKCLRPSVRVHLQDSRHTPCCVCLSLLAPLTGGKPLPRVHHWLCGMRTLATTEVI